MNTFNCNKCLIDKNSGEFRKGNRICIDCSNKRDKERYKPKHGRKDSKELIKYKKTRAENVHAEWLEHLKKCVGCKIEKPHKDYSVRPHGNISNLCLDCIELRKEKANFNKTLSKKELYNLRFYGLKPKQYNELLEKQNNTCAICKKHKTLYVDHCHTAKIVRGLVCRSCNTLLGMAEDNCDILANALEYLKNIDENNIVVSGYMAKYEWK